MINLTKHITKMFTTKFMAISLTMLYIFSLIPLLTISWYNYPSADDYTNGSACHIVWEKGHSVFEVLETALKHTGEEWVQWRGCFTSSFLSAIPPNIWHERLYPLTTWIILGMLTFSAIYFFHAVFVKALGADKYTSHSITMLVLFVSVNCMCETGRVEAFYWYSGAINYSFMHGMSLFFYGSLISIVYGKKRKKIQNTAAASILGFLTAGGNQMTMLNTAIVLMTVIILITWQQKWKSCRVLGIPIGIFYMGFILAVISPGNFRRASSVAGMHPVKAILVSFYYCFDLALNQWTTWSVILIMLAMIPLFWHMTNNISFAFSHPLIWVVFGYGLVSAMITPPLFAVGNIEAGRLQAQIYLMYILTLTLCIGYVIGWIRKHFDRRQKETAESSIWLLGCIIFFVFGSAITIIPEPHYYTCSSALTDLLNGNAGTYKSDQEKRIKVYQEKNNGIVQVNMLTVHPSLLYFVDITEDEQDWKNCGVARFYGLDGVVVHNW